MALFDPHGKVVLLHNRHGIRVELSFDKEGALELWLSPRAATSRDYRDRNFSNRDDHTRLFDRITLRGLSAAAFVRCDYDAFHSTLHFRAQVLHVLSVFDAPCVVLWCEQQQIVDFKSDKADSAVTRTARAFEVEHPDRGALFRFAAVASSGTVRAGRAATAGAFVHQLDLDEGRSTYAKLVLRSGQRVAIAGALADEAPLLCAKRMAGMAAARLDARNEKMIAAAACAGACVLRGRPKLQRLLDVNRRVLLSMQDVAGSIRAALNRIYYLIWVRDGAMIAAFQAYAGNADALARWTRFLLANPTVIETGRNKGRTFLMLVNKTITKWEEDGVFFAIWSAFTAWTQTGDARFMRGENLRVLEEAMAWLERYCFDKHAGLFGRYYRCESPFGGARDDGFDNAVGVPTTPGDIVYKGRSIRRSFDVYINLLCYSSYLMLAAATSGAAARRHVRKAAALAGRLTPFSRAGLPDYGRLRDQHGRMVAAGPYGLDRCDYMWALTVPPFHPAPWRQIEMRRALFADLMRAPDRTFLAAYFALLAALDPAWFDEADVLRAIERAATHCYRPGQYLAMPNTVVEQFNVPDGNLYHDVRPQAFSIGPLLAAVTGLGLRRLPFGLAVRPTRLLNEIRDYQYKQARITLQFERAPRGHALVVNGQPVPCTRQLPEQLLRPGANHITVRPQSQTQSWQPPCLDASTVRLERVSLESTAVVYHVTGYGHNMLEVGHARAASVTVQSRNGKLVVCKIVWKKDRAWLVFAGTGAFAVRLQWQRPA